MTDTTDSCAYPYGIAPMDRKESFLFEDLIMIHRIVSPYRDIWFAQNKTGSTTITRLTTALETIASLFLSIHQIHDFDISEPSLFSRSGFADHQSGLIPRW
jgi:hypothetical protein